MMTVETCFNCLNAFPVTEETLLQQNISTVKKLLYHFWCRLQLAKVKHEVSPCAAPVIVVRNGIVLICQFSTNTFRSAFGNLVTQFTQLPVTSLDTFKHNDKNR